MEQTKTCSKCKRTLPLNSSYFYKSLNYYRGECINCTKAATRKRYFLLHKKKKKHNRDIKTCSKCKRTLPLNSSYFYKNNRANGYRGECINCTKAARKRYYFLHEKKNKHHEYLNNRIRSKSSPGYLSFNHYNENIDSMQVSLADIENNYCLGVKEFCVLLKYNLTDEEINLIYDYFFLEKTYKEIDHIKFRKGMLSKQIYRAKLKILSYYKIDISKDLRSQFLALRRR